MSTAPGVHIQSLVPTVLDLEAGEHWWCRCGRSGHMPLCDGSHKGTGIAPVKFTLAEKRKVCLCNCKHTKNPPYCDGAHNELIRAQT